MLQKLKTYSHRHMTAIMSDAESPLLVGTSVLLDAEYDASVVYGTEQEFVSDWDADYYNGIIKEVK